MKLDIFYWQSRYKIAMSNLTHTRTGQNVQTQTALMGHTVMAVFTVTTTVTTPAVEGLSTPMLRCQHYLKKNKTKQKQIEFE